MSETSNKIVTLLEDEAFVNQLLALETPEEVSALFAKKGITLSVKEIELLKSRLENTSNEELSEQELEYVAGGVDLGLIDEVVKSIVTVSTRICEYIRRW